MITTIQGPPCYPVTYYNVTRPPGFLGSVSESERQPIEMFGSFDDGRVSRGGSSACHLSSRTIMPQACDEMQCLETAIDTIKYRFDRI